MTTYLTYHSQVGYTPFFGQGLIRPVYFTLLASHVILATVVIPLILITIIFALKGNFVRHPEIAGWALPLWFYVSISGVLVYLLGFHLYTPVI